MVPSRRRCGDDKLHRFWQIVNIFVLLPASFGERLRPDGGIGRHAGLKILWPVMAVPVRSRLRVLFRSAKVLINNALALLLFSVTTAPRPPIGRFEPPHYRLQRKKGGVKAERVKTGPVCSQRRPAGESKACFAEPPQSKRRIPLRRKPAKAPVLAQPNSDPAKATCGWFWVPFATKSTKPLAVTAVKRLLFREKFLSLSLRTHLIINFCKWTQEWEPCH